MKLLTLRYLLFFLLTIYNLNDIVVYSQNTNFTINSFTNSYSNIKLKLKENDLDQYSLFYTGFGASSYKFLNLYSIESNFIFPFQQNIYFKLGIIYFKKIKPENHFQKHPLYLNIYTLYKLKLSTKITSYFGVGFAFFPSTGILFSIDILTNYKINNYLILGIELKQALNSKYDDYYKFPFPSFNIIFIL